AQVVDGDRGGPAAGVEVDPLHVVEVHGDVAGVADEAHALAVGGDVDLFVNVGAVEEHRVGAGLALERIAAVAGVPDEQVVALAADEHVVAGAAVQRQADQIGGQTGGVHHVIAAEAADRQPVVRPLGADDVHERGQAPDGDASPVVKGRDLDDVV